MFQAPDLTRDIWRRPDTSTDAEIIPSLLAGYTSGRKVAKENRDAREAAYVTGGEVNNPRSFMDSFSRAFFGAGAIQAESNPLYQLKVAEARAQLAESGVKMQGIILHNKMLEQESMFTLEDQRRMAELRPQVESDPDFFDKNQVNPFRTRQYQGLWDKMQDNYVQSKRAKTQRQDALNFERDMFDVGPLYRAKVREMETPENQGSANQLEALGIIKERLRADKEAQKIREQEAKNTVANVGPGGALVNRKTGEVIYSNPKVDSEGTETTTTTTETEAVEPKSARSGILGIGAREAVEGHGKITVRKTVKSKPETESKATSTTTTQADAIPLPADKSQLKAGQAYNTSRGVATWDGEKFVQ